MAVVGVVIVACSGTGTSKIEDRLDRLEHDVAALKDASNQLTVSTEAIRKATTSALADVAERFYRAGITDEENKNIPRWWCVGDGNCERTLAGCERVREYFGRRDGVVLPSCFGTRVAFCGGPRRQICTGRRDICVRVSAGDSSSECLGSE